MLIDLYTNTDGANWIDNSGWLGAVGAECTWVRVTCDGAGAHVYQITLYSNNLVGSLPSLAALTNLSWFAVDNNQLSGSIPSLADLTNLTAFVVSNNQLRGDVPDVPSPNGLSPGYSGLCPNALNPTPNADWDAATAQTPWYQNCYGFFEDGFED